jgi:hypothetical protein
MAKMSDAVQAGATAIRQQFAETVGGSKKNREGDTDTIKKNGGEGDQYGPKVGGYDCGLCAVRHPGKARCIR